MTKLFGTDGIRSRAGEYPLDTATIRIVGASLASHLRQELGKAKPLLIIGRDTRESGSSIEQAFVTGAASAGAICKSAGVITTPGVAYLARTLPADAGVVISASHNPYEDNGIKIFSPSGRKLEDATERLIEADVARGLMVTDASNDHDVEHDESSLQLRYLEFLKNEIGAGLSLSSLTIVTDCANGAASHLAPKLFAQLGAKVVAVNDKPDGRNINYNCGSLYIDGLMDRVTKENADIGVAFDGDADRALFVDARGNFIDGDATLWVLANYLHAKEKLRRATVVATVMSNIGLEVALRSQGIKLVRTDVGDKYVLEELLQSGASLGGEQSGHLIFPEVSWAGDGMITALSLIRVMVESGHSLEELTKGFQRYPQTLKNVRVAEKRPFDQMPAVKKLAQSIEAELGERGRLLLRYSGTEPLARVMIEGESQTAIEEYANSLINVLREEIGERSA